MKAVQAAPVVQLYSNLVSHPHALQKSLDPPFPVTVKRSSGNSSILWRGLTVLGSVDPYPRALRFPFGGGLESTLRLRVSSERVGGLRTSKMDSECADDSPGCSSDIRC